MTPSRVVVLSALLTLAWPAEVALAAADGWGASYSFNAIAPATNHLLSAKTTLVPGRLPPSAAGTGPLFIWPGLSNGKGDLIQTTLDAWGDNKGACGAATGQWCGETSIFGSFGQLSGSSAAFDPDDHITIQYQLGSDNNTWTQTMTSLKLGKVVSTFSHASGPMLAGGFGFATEADKDSYTIDTQYYLCTEFHLAAADPTWGPKSGGGNGAKYGATGSGSGPGTAKNLRTPDAGLTWLVDLITLPAMNPQGTQTPPPAIQCGSAGAGGTSGAGGAAATGGAAGSAGRGSGAGGAAATGGSSATGGGAAGGRATGGHATGGGATGGAPGSAGASGAASGGTAFAGNSAAGGSSVAGLGAGGSSGALGASGSSPGGALGSLAGAATAGASGAPASSDGTSGCSCNIPSHRSAPRGLLALLAGAVLLARRRRRN